MKAVKNVLKYVKEIYSLKFGISTNEWSMLNRWMNYDEECCESFVTQFVMKIWWMMCWRMLFHRLLNEVWNECWNKCCDEVCDVLKLCWSCVELVTNLSWCIIWWNICHSICCERSAKDLLKVCDAWCVESLWCMMCWKFVMHDVLKVCWKFVESLFIIYLS